MTIPWLEAGSNGTYGITVWTGKSGTVTSDATIFHSGLRSIKCDSGSTNVSSSVRKSNVLADAGRRISNYRYFSALPTTDANCVVSTNSANSTTIWRLQLRTTGFFRFVGSGNGADGTVACPTGQWVRISVSYTITSTTVNEFRAWMDTGSGPVLIATATNLTLAAVGTNQLQLGYSTAPGASIVTYVADVYVDDAATLDDPGDIHVVAKLPTTINVNTFDTVIGTGAVNERPVSTTNGRSMAATGTATCNFNIEAAAVGDVDISGATIVGYLGWLWASGVSTDQITVNGVNTTIAMTTSAAYWFAAAVSSAYPSGAAGIGVNRPTSSATDCNFYEGGVLIAYIPAAAAPPVTAGFDTSGWQENTPRRFVHVPY